MTTDEIRALIAKKISGQGSAIDVGNGLEPILNALCDAVENIPSLPPSLANIKTFTGVSDEPKEITIEDFRELTPILDVDGTLYVMSTVDSIIIRDLQPTPSAYFFYINCLEYDDVPAIFTASYLLVYNVREHGNDKFYIVKGEY